MSVPETEAFSQESYLFVEKSELLNAVQKVRCSKPISPGHEDGSATRATFAASAELYSRPVAPHVSFSRQRSVGVVSRLATPRCFGSNGASLAHSRPVLELVSKLILQHVNLVFQRH
jgi:hypothetical protein